MGVGSTTGSALPQGIARIELSPGSPVFSPGQIVNGRVAQVGPKGAVLEIAGRLATVVTELDLSVGETIQLSVKEVNRDQTLLQLVGREGILLNGEPAGESQLARLMAYYRLPADRPHLNAVRTLLARGAPITREGVERLARAEQPEAPARPDLEATDSVLLRLIDSYDLPGDQAHLYAARQLLGRGLALTRENVEQMARSLVKLGATSEADFQAGAFLQTSGLPLTRSALEIVRSVVTNPVPMGPRMRELQQTIAWLAELLQATAEEEGLPERDLRELADEAARQLAQRIVRAEGMDRTAIAETLRRVCKDQGTSLENQLARVLSGYLEPGELEGDLRALLTRLADIAAGSGALTSDAAGATPGDAAKQQALVHLSRVAPGLTGALQTQQLKNAAEPELPAEPWLAFQVPMSGPPGEQIRTVDLRISRRADGGVDPKRVRLLLRLELPQLQKVEVRLDLLDKQINCYLSSSSGESLPVLRDQFASLRGGLERLGYLVGVPRFGLLTTEVDPTDVAVEVPACLVRVDVRG